MSRNDGADDFDDTGDSDYSLDPDDQLQPEDTLVDRGVDDVLDEGYAPPEYQPRGLRYNETLDSRLAEEEPEPGIDDWNGVDDSRAGRLVAPDEGSGIDTESEEIATDVGIDGAAASAEEAAVHYIDDDRDDSDDDTEAEDDD